MDAKQMPNGKSEAVENKEISSGEEDLSFEPWTKSQVDEWRKVQQPFSLWLVWVLQFLVALFIVLILTLLVKSPNVIWSVAYGALCVLLPSAMFVHGVVRNAKQASVSKAMARMVFWESAKIVLTIAMLCMAPKVVLGINWLAMLAGFVVTIKVYWLALWLQSIRKKLPLVCK